MGARDAVRDSAKIGVILERSADSVLSVVGEGWGGGLAAMA
ncbi:hypothetical protein MuYL_3948 [Mucilaginibacter xinganensis]|uniref:Uncharacterized protein n=1 Tax=Mucilaginibacter xinganensis TaxID=1234841 RepID=A0A223P121_9SPHI|nr:hypothetical protein MuYL_3948 [Mucilaginibacter xinganensis]